MSQPDQEPTIIQKLEQAERWRAYGSYQAAYELSTRNSPINTIDTEAIKHAPPDKIKLSTYFWRIDVCSLLELAQQNRDGENSAFYLRQVQRIILELYDAPETKTVAREMKHNYRGIEYEMWVEMLRDIAKHQQAAYGLTGNKTYLETAQNVLSQAGAEASPSTQTKALADMELQLVKARLGKHFDFEQFKTAYLNVMDFTKEVRNWDRQATVSWWYLGQSFRHRKFKELPLGWQNLREATEAEGMSAWKDFVLKKAGYQSGRNMV